MTWTIYRGKNTPWSSRESQMSEPNPYLREHASPSGAYVVLTAANEVRMSHWIVSAILVDASKADIFDFGDMWSADSIRWLDDRRVMLQLRHYPGDRSAEVTVDAEQRTATLNGAPLTLAELARWMR
jgi:hypothetical protein